MYFLRNNDDLQSFKVTLRTEDHAKSLFRGYNYGPTFGYGFDVHISDNAASNTGSYADFGDTYNLPSGYTVHYDNTNALLAGSRDFTPSEVEVLYIN